MLYGVDVWEGQGNIDWDALNAVANFVIIRASFGTMRKDNQFDRNQAEARRVQAAAGPLGIGYYYFAYPTVVGAVESADYFVDNLGPLQEGEVLALDLEGDVGPDPVGWSLAFLQHIEARTGVKALIYLNQSLVASHDWTPVVAGNYGLWIADYDGDKNSVPPMGQWPVVAMKQWTDVDVVNGIASKVDGDTFYGDFDAWKAYGYKTAATNTPPPAPAPEPAPEPAPAPDPLTEARNTITLLNNHVNELDGQLTAANVKLDDAKSQIASQLLTIADLNRRLAQPQQQPEVPQSPAVPLQVQVVPGQPHVDNPSLPNDNAVWPRLLAWLAVRAKAIAAGVATTAITTIVTALLDPSVLTSLQHDGLNAGLGVLVAILVHKIPNKQ